MKRDWNLLRDIMRSVEACKVGERIYNEHEYPSEAWSRYEYHLLLLHQGGFLVTVKDAGEESPMLSFAGYELFEMIGETETWRGICLRASSLGIGLTVDTIKLLYAQEKRL